MFCCDICGVDMDLIGLDNLSPICGHPICENCIDEFNYDREYYLKKFKQEDYFFNY